MGLISKTVIIKWSKKVRKWYESKGYIFTKYGDEFEVNVNDLTKGSHALIKVKCDCNECKTPINKLWTWKHYLKTKKEDNKIYCQRCSTLLFGKIKERNKNLLKSDSFYNWCIKYNRLDILNRWDYSLNNYNPNEILYSTHTKYYFKCPQGLHKSELKSITNFTSGSEGVMNCNQCNSFAQWGIDNLGEDFLEKYWDYNKNINISPWKIASHYNKKVWIKCQEKDYHGSYDISPHNFVNNRRCSYCASKIVHPLDSLGKLLEDKGLLHLWSDKNKRSPYEYPPWSGQEFWWKCPEGLHKDYHRKISASNRLNFNCPKCSKERDESFLQEKVRLYLNELKYIVLHENECTIIPINPKTKYKLPFDNEINNLKLIIETHGIQHYKICTWHKSLAKKFSTTPEYQLHYQKLKDRYKKIFALSQGYFYLEIPYWTDDNEETWKKLIDDKIKEVKLIIERSS